MAINKIIYGSQTLIDLTADTVETNALLRGYTAHDKSGAVITGICDYDADTSDGDASASEILSGKIAYANGNRLVGTMTNRGAVSGTISDVSVPYIIQSGYHDGAGSVSIAQVEANKIVPNNIKAGIEILGVTGDYSGEGVTAQSKSVVPYTTAQTVLPDSGYDYLSQVNVAAIAYTETPNAYGTTVTIGTVAP